MYENNEESSKIANSKKSPEGIYFVVGIAVALGGHEDLSKLISELHADFPAPILVIQHMDNNPDFEIDIADFLKPVTQLKVKEMEDGDRLEKGTVYAAVPNHYMIVNGDGTISLASLDKTEFTRPAADVTFVTLAMSFKDRVIGVILTGGGQDGALGALAINKAGGKIIAQEDPKVPSMPEAAIRVDDVDFITPLVEIAPLLINLVKEG